MKRIAPSSVIFAVLLCFLSTPAVWSQAIVSNTDGFMGNTWGSHVSAVKNVRKVSSYYDKSIQIYQMEDRPDQFAARWQLLFRNDLLMAAKLRVEGKRLTGLWEQVEKDLGTTFGKPTDAYDGEHFKRRAWDSAQTFAEADYGSSTWVKAVLVSKEMYRQWIAAEKVKDGDRRLACNYTRFGYGSFSKYCVDQNTVRKLPDRIISADVWNISLVEDSIAVRYAMDFDCGKRLSRRMSVIHYKNDHVDESRGAGSGLKADAAWRPVQGIYKDVCNFLCK